MRVVCLYCSISCLFVYISKYWLEMSKLAAIVANGLSHWILSLAMSAWPSTPTTRFLWSLRRWIVVLCTLKSFMPILLPCAFYTFYGASYISSPLTVGCFVLMHSLWHASVTVLSGVRLGSIWISSKSWESWILMTINLSTDSPYKSICLSWTNQPVPLWPSQ